jgi:hypothetical protein
LPDRAVVYYDFVPMILGIGHIKRIAEHVHKKSFLGKRFERKAVSALSSKDEHEITRTFKNLSEGRLTHHARNLFTNEKLGTEERVKLFQACAHLNADKMTLAHGFEKMMERSTPHERNTVIYPRILEQVKQLKGVSHAMTSVMMRGWISSCSIITDSNHELAQSVLELPPSARG